MAAAAELGGETQEYIDDPGNTSLLSINTIANYDPEVIQFLTYPPGTEVERNANGCLEVITPNIERPNVIFFHPVVEGKVALTKEWSIEVSACMLRRYDNGSLVIWRPGFTLWINTYTTSEISPEVRAGDILSGMSKDAQGLENDVSESLHKIRYWLEELVDNLSQRACYISGLTATEQINIAVYFDLMEECSEVDKIWKTLECTTNT
jgi:hypothetical protein